MLLAALSRDLVRDGALTLVDADGTTHLYGRGSRSAGVVVRLHAPCRRGGLALLPGLGLREAYVEGTLTLERGDAYELVELYARNLERLAARSALGRAALEALLASARGAALSQGHAGLVDPPEASGYFNDPGMTLEEAEEAEKRHLAAKLVLRPGQRVLQIGGVDGGLALHLGEAGGDVAAIGTSPEQVAAAQRRARDAGLAGRVSFHVRALEEETGRYDRIAASNERARGLFRRVRELLVDDGVAVVQCLGRAHGAGALLAVARLLGAPGTPSLAELVAEVERERLHVTDVEILRFHRAETLRCRRERLRAGWQRATEAHGARDCRALEMDLALAEAAFRHGGMVVFQLQLTKRADAVPLTRSYMYEGAGVSRDSGARASAGWGRVGPAADERGFSDRRLSV